MDILLFFFDIKECLGQGALHGEEEMIVRGVVYVAGIVVTLQIGQCHSGGRRLRRSNSLA